MTLDQAIPIVEGKLYAWGSLVLRYPAARISAYDALRVDASPGASEPEQWVLQHDQDLVDASRIETVLKRLPDRDRALVRLRYVERWSWVMVARKLSTSRAAVYQIRDRVIYALACEFGLFVEAAEKSS